MATDELGDDIAAYAAEPVELLAAEADGSYTPPQNADDANRMLRRLRAHEARRAEVDARYDAEVRMLTAWRDDRVAGIDRETARLTLSLEGWMRDRNAQAGVVTEHLPAGELWLRQGRPSMVVDDDEAVIEWAINHDVHVRQKYEVDKTALGAVVTVGAKANVPRALADAGPDHDFHLAVDAQGDVVPGVLFRKPTRRTFTPHPNKENHE